MEATTKVIIELSKEEAKTLKSTLEKVQHQIGVASNKYETKEVDLAKEIIKEL